MNCEEEVVIYYGTRGKEFRNLIFNLLSKCKLKKKYIDLLLDADGMKVYNDVFTSSSANVENNYEVYEQLGDISANKFIVWYMYRRFPQLTSPKYVKVVARLRINYGSKQSFSTIADSVGFWPFITASEDERNRCKKPLLEDALEAFIGATEYLIDTKIRIGVGYSIVYDILAKLFDDIHISLKYETLYDAKTRLKEIFDFFKSEELGVLEYQTVKNVEEKLNTTIVYQVNNKRKLKIGEGIASLKADSEQKAAAQGIEFMRSKGYVKPVPELYSKFL